MRSERKCSIFDLLWPDPSIPEGESEKFVFLENNNIFERKKIIHSLSCLTRVYLCAEIETIWIFDPCQKNFIFVWFLHGCPLKLKKKKKIEAFASRFLSYLLSSLTKTTDYVLGFFRQGKFAGSLLVNILLAHS